MTETPKAATEIAGEKMSAMWTQVADRLEGHAIESAAVGRWAEALPLGVAADGARWQATGEGDFITFGDLLAAANAILSQSQKGKHP